MEDIDDVVGGSRWAGVILAGRSEVLNVGQFDSYAVLSVNADATCTIRIEEGRDRTLDTRLGWRRSRGRKPRYVVITNTGATTATIEIVFDVGGETVDRRVAISSSTVLPIRRDLVSGSAVSTDVELDKWSGDEVTQHDTLVGPLSADTVLVTAVANVNGVVVKSCAYQGETGIGSADYWFLYAGNAAGAGAPAGVIIGHKWADSDLGAKVLQRSVFIKPGVALRRSYSIAGAAKRLNANATYRTL